jgi:transcriptional regulator with XRE-family HTH domain
MTNYTKTRHTLPPDVQALFTPEQDTEARNKLISALRERGWTLQSISDAAGISRERVRQITDASTAGEWSGQELPYPPVKPVSKPREYIEPDPDTLTRLLELQIVAQGVRANSPRGRAEAEEYTRLIWEEHNGRGVTLYRLAKRLGITHGALRYRLARYGYKPPKTGSSRVYTPIKAENRAIA